MAKKAKEKEKVFTIAQAFEKAKQGVLCIGCNRRIPHAIIQRHRLECEITIEDDEIQVIQ